MTFPTVRPSRPAYPPPIPSGFIDPSGKTPVERALRTQQAFVDQYYNPWLAAHSPDIAPDVLKDNEGAFGVSDAALALPEALAAVKADADAAQAKVDKVVKSQKVDAGDIAAQLAADRFWRRTERTLDSVKDTSMLASAARDLITNASDSEIPVISEELASYLASRNVPTGWLNDALAARVPGLDEAQAEARLKSKQHAVLAQNNSFLLRAIANHNPPPPLLDPYSPAITARPYSNGEPSDPSGQ